MTLFIGWLLGVWSQTFFGRLSTRIATINDHITQVDKIELLAHDYWLKHGCGDSQEEKVSAARLRAALDVSAYFEPVAKEVFKARFKEFAEADISLYDLATGGDFEVADRRSDPDRAVEVSGAVHRLRMLLRDQRSRLFWSN